MNPTMKISRWKLWCTMLVLAIHSFFPIVAHAINLQLMNSPGGLVCSASNLNSDIKQSGDTLNDHAQPCPYCQSSQSSNLLPTIDSNWTLPQEVSAGYPLRFFSATYSLFVWATPPSRAPPA